MAAAASLTSTISQAVGDPSPRYHNGAPVGLNPNACAALRREEPLACSEFDAYWATLERLGVTLSEVKKRELSNAVDAYVQKEVRQVSCGVVSDACLMSAIEWGRINNNSTLQ